MVGARDTESVVSGSIYKLYVVLYLFKEMNEGRRDWSTPILGTTTSACFDRMTIASTNPCAEEWLNQFGRVNLNKSSTSQPSQARRSAASSSSGR